MSIIKKSFYLAEIYTSRVLYFECMSTDSYESSGSVDYDGIKKSVISLQNRRGKCNCFQAFIFHLYSFFFSGALDNDTGSLYDRFDGVVLTYGDGQLLNDSKEDKSFCICKHLGKN